MGHGRDQKPSASCCGFIEGMDDGDIKFLRCFPYFDSRFSTLIHCDLCRYVHLFTNLIVQVLLGIPMEMVHKWWRVSIIYCMGVFAGETSSDA